MTVRVLVVHDEPDVEMLFRQLLPEVKARRPNLPVFMISAYGDAERVQTALKRGASKFITKPVDFPLLKRDVSRVVADARSTE